jgi:hypothetical protein
MGATPRNAVILSEEGGVGGSEGPPSDSASLVHRRGSFASHPPYHLAQDDSGVSYPFAIHTVLMFVNSRMP